MEVTSGMAKGVVKEKTTEDKPEETTVKIKDLNHQGKEESVETEIPQPGKNGSKEITSEQKEAFEQEQAESQALEEELPIETGESIEEKIRKYEEQNLRIRAEFANYKRRVEREQDDFAMYFKGEILKSLLPVLDDFKMMFDKSSKGENEQSILDGAKLIYEKLQQILEKEGVTKVHALGEKFDPELHEALMMKQIENEEEHDKVIEVFQDGFKLQDRLLRPSKVIVGKYEND
jgi:molecular chaperone GrpE